MSMPADKSRSFNEWYGQTCMHCPHFMHEARKSFSANAPGGLSKPAVSLRAARIVTLIPAAAAVAAAPAASKTVRLSHFLPVIEYSPYFPDAFWDGDP